MTHLGTAWMNTQVHISHACPSLPGWPTRNPWQGESREACWSDQRPSVTTPEAGESQQVRDFTKWDIFSEKQNLRKSSTVGSSYPVTPSTKGEKQQWSEKNAERASSSAVLSPHHSPAVLSIAPIHANVSLDTILQKHLEAFFQDIPASIPNSDEQPQSPSPFQNQESIPFGKQK